MIRKSNILFLIIIAVLLSCRDDKAETQMAIVYAQRDVEKLMSQNGFVGKKYEVEIDTTKVKIPKDFLKKENYKKVLGIPFWIGKKEDSLYLEYSLNEGYLEDAILRVEVSPKLYKMIDSSQKTRPIPRYRGWDGMIIRELGDKE